MYCPRCERKMKLVETTTTEFDIGADSPRDMEVVVWECKSCDIQELADEDNTGDVE